MSKPSRPHPLKSDAAKVKVILRHHLGVAPRAIDPLTAGQTNLVFEVRSSKGLHVIRIGGDERKLQDFMKEQWVTQRASKAGIPVAEILEVGRDLISQPYMIQAKARGTVGTKAENPRAVLEELGDYARKIHQIETKGFGNNFDWSQNVLSKDCTWREFLEKDFKVHSKTDALAEWGILTPQKVRSLRTEVKRLLGLKKVETRLNHGDLRLKNVLVNKAGKISAVIDWEDSVSSLAPHWDLAIALHDLPVDDKQAFLEGYGIKFDDLQTMLGALRVFNTLHYAARIQKLSARDRKQQLDSLKMRLNGCLDLFL